jgi:hypothetical protein
MCWFYPTDCVHLRKEAVASETSCVCSVVYVYLEWWRKSFYLLVMCYKGTQVQHTNPGTGFPHCEYQNIKIPEYTKLTDRTPPCCDTKAVWQIASSSTRSQLFIFCQEHLYKHLPQCTWSKWVLCGHAVHMNEPHAHTTGWYAAITLTMSIPMSTTANHTCSLAKHRTAPWRRFLHEPKHGRANVTVLSVLTCLRFYNSVHQLEQ